MRKLLLIPAFWSIYVFPLFAQKNSPNILKFQDSIQQLIDKGWYKDALDLANKTIEEKKMTNEQSMDSELLRVAHLNNEMGEFETAKMQVDSFLKLTNNKNNALYLNGLVTLSKVLINQGNATVADSTIELTDKHIVDTLSQNNNYIQTLQNKGRVYILKQDYQQALSHFQRVANLLEKKIFENPIMNLQNQIYIVDTYTWLQDYQAAEKQLKKVEEYAKNNKLLQHPVYEEGMEIGGYLYLFKGNYRKSVYYWENAEKIAKKSFGPLHVKYSQIINNLGAIYQRLEDYPNAEQRLLQSLDIEKKLNGDANIAYAKRLYNVATINGAVGQYHKAKELAEKAKLICYENGDTLNVFYGTVNLFIGNILIKTKAYEEAQQLNLYAAEILANQKAWNYLHIAYNRIGDTYRFQADFEKAQFYYEKCVELESQFLKDKINSIIHTQINLSNVAAYKKEQKKAWFHLVNAKQECRTLMGVNTPLYTIINSRLGKLMESQDSLSRATFYHKSAIYGLIKQLQYYYPTLNEENRADFLITLEEVVASFYSHTLNNTQNIPALTTTMQNVELAIDGLGFESSKNLIEMVAESDNEALTATYHEWLDNKKKLRNAFSLSIQDRKDKQISLDSLLEQVRFLEKKMGWENKAQQFATFTFQDIRKKLEEQEAVLDFVRFRIGDFTLQQTDSIFYCALLTRKSDTHPILIPLAKEQILEDLLAGDISNRTSNYVTNPAINEALYDQLWTPLLPYLSGIEKVHLIPTGLLHKVSFAALSAPEKQSPLIKDFNLIYHSNMRSFIQNAHKNFTNTDISLLGGAIYDLQLDSMRVLTPSILVNQKPEINKSRGVDTTALRYGLSFDYLPATKKEVEDIAHQFDEKNWKVNLWTGKNALEDYVKLSSGKNAPRILHIATHGFFFNALTIDKVETNNIRENIMVAKNPLFRSGLVFTGANNTWLKNTKIDHLEDGILTAFEINNLNLSNTELVVLSACDTGRGDIQQGEGVFGLQRAFKLAGVDKLIISLWKVPDEATSELMRTFYTFYLQGESIESAFMQAQRTLMEKEKANNSFNWGAFILLN